MWIVYTFSVLVLALVLYLVLRVALGAGRYQRELDESVRHEHTRVVDCPETGLPAAVTAAADSAGNLSVRNCSHWSESRQCDGGCVKAIEQSPDGCLVRTVLTEWFAGKSCVLCGRELGEINWFDFKPALMGSDQAIAEWHEIPVEVLPRVLSTHRPVCAECYRKRALI